LKSKGTCKTTPWFKKHHFSFYCLIRDLSTNTKWVQNLYDWFNPNEIKTCGCCSNKVKFINFNDGYRNFCSRKCQTIWQLSEEGILKKKSGWTQEKRDATTKKIIETNNLKYGGPSPSSSKDVVKKCRQTKLKNHGDINYNNRDKCRNTCLSLYGVDHVSKVDDIHNKQQSYRKYPYEFPSGRIIKIQGYEKFAINYLLNLNYDENDIITDSKNQPKKRNKFKKTESWLNQP
jgi:endogenous inhibitor of DNA gyrase (YacG/DUF329 family)